MRSVRKLIIPLRRWIFALMPAIVPTQQCASANAVYDALVGRGVKVSPQVTLSLPKPVLADGLAEDAQRQVIDSVLAGKYDWDMFTRKSLVSPFLLKISEGVAESGPIVRRVDLYFVAYGSLKKLASEDYLQKQLSLSVTNEQGEEGGRSKVLTTDELRKRGIAAGQKPDDPRWVAVTSTLLSKVKISLTTQNIKTENADSIIIASVADPRFVNDAEFPDSWQSLSVDDAGQRQIGAPQPYVGMGSYVKSTRLAKPDGAIFIEYHVDFVEPHDWFHGTNLLRSKLPIVAQEMVRKFRRSMSE